MIESRIGFALEHQSRSSTPYQVMVEQALLHEYRHFAGHNRDTDVGGEEIVAALLDGEVIASGYSPMRTELVIKMPEMYVRIWWYDHHPEVGWDVVGANADSVLALGHAISNMAVPIRHDEPNIVPVKFWALDAHGQPGSQTRKIEVNPWSVIQDNYPSEVRAHLQELIDLSEPATGGKLVLWHGLPGTGKTHFLRSLAYAWREWCDVSYIVDPDELFRRAYYLMQTVLSGDQEKRWHLLVLEDTGEFMLNDAHGQGLSKLLNLTDGLVGQGLKLLVLMTTNEKIFRLHPAVSRPGRCLAEIAFTSFTRKEALRWANAHDIETLPINPAHDEFTLADLYEAEARAHIANDRPTVSTGQYA